MRNNRAQELFPDLLEPFLGKPSSSVIPTAKDYGDDFDIIGLMKSAKDPDTGLMRDLKIEDGDLKHASSYYDYCFNVVGKDAHPPWMMQMWIAIMLFGEFCPVCSDKRWLSLDFMVNRVNVSTPSVSIVEHIQILKHGVCPKCKRHKHELMKKYGLKNYVELVNVLGQRCVTGDTLILTDRGLRYVEAFSHGRKKGFSPFSERLFNGREVEQASDFYVAQELEQVHRVTLANGADIKGTSDHPLRTLTGFKRIENLREGDYVAVSVNSQMWGTDIPSFADAFAKADVPTTKGVHTHVKRTSGYATLDWFTVLGLWVAEGRSTGITNFDPEVNSLIYNEYLKTYSKYHVRNVDQKYVKVMGSRGRRFLEYFLGDDLRRGSAKQHIPACVLAAPKQYVAAFLRGLYEGDGGFNGQTLSYYTISRRLAHELHALLLNFGFSPVIRKSRAWASNGSPKQVAKTTYTVSIVGFDIEAFGKEIGFITKRKRDLLTSRVSELHSREKHMPFTGDKLPPPVKDEVLTLLYTCTAALREIPLPTCLDGKGHAVDVKREFKGWKPRACIGRNTLLTRKPFYWNDPNFVEKGIVDLVKRLREHNVALTRPKLKRILDQLHHFKQFLPPKVLLDITHLESYLDKSVWWVRVSKINRNIGLRQTYDVTLPQTHQFVANGIINHNSGKSAQAASMGTYVTHRYLKFPRLADMTTAMQKSTELTGTFVSLTFSKAFSLLWTPYKNIIEDSQWYQDFHACLDVASEKYGLELYRKKDEFIKYYVKGLRIYPSGPKSQTLRGDCLVGSTLINTDQGFVYFRELNFPEGATPTKGSIDTPYGQREFSHTYKKESREVYKVNTRNNFSLKGTPEHPVLVLTADLNFNWVRLDELKVGDWIVSTTKKNKPLFGTNPISLDQATILGTFTANGYKSTFSSKDKKVIKRVYSAIKRITGNYPRVHGSQVSIPTHYVAGNGKGHCGSFVDVLASWGYSSVKSAQKQIPLSIRTSPREILHEYLEAYFACDSAINGGATSRQRIAGLSTSPEVEISSASRKLVRQLQIILLQVYGLVGRVCKAIEIKSMGRYKQNAPKKYIRWVLTLTGHDAFMFQQTFKRAKIQKYAERFKDSPPGIGSDRRLVPHLRRHLRKFVASHACSGKQYFIAADGSKIKRPTPINLGGTRSGPMPEAIAYAITADHIQFVSDLDPELGAKVRKIIAIGAHYEEVVSVVATRQRMPVYDFTVPRGHAFTANGLSSHNTRFLAAIDELGLFPLPTGNEEEDEKSERANSDEAHKSLSNSLATVQAVNEQLLAAGLNPPPALLMGVSSPISMRDKVMRLLADSRTDEGKKYILGINLPTWKVNPHMPRSNPMIAKAYASNPEKAERDFGANPPRVSQTFMKSTQVPFSLFKHKNSHNLSYQYDEPGLLYPKLQRVWTPKFPSVVSLDAGHVNNSFSLTAGHFDFDRQKTVVSTVLEVMVHDLRAIDFNLTYKHLILPILKDLNAVLLLADQWQSLDLLSRAREDRGKNPKGKSRTIAVQHSPKRKSFDALAAMLSSGSIELPYLSQKDYDDVNTNYIDYTTLKDEPVKHLLLQMLTVRDPGPDKAPTKGEGFTDDMFRALVLLTKIHDPKVMERLSEARQWLKDEGSVGMPIPVFQPRFY